jgi:hypothetical protein
MNVVIAIKRRESIPVGTGQPRAHHPAKSGLFEKSAASPKHLGSMTVVDRVVRDFVGDCMDQTNRDHYGISMAVTHCSAILSGSDRSESGGRLAALTSHRTKPCLPPTIRQKPYVSVIG